MEPLSTFLRADLAPLIIALPTADRQRSFVFYGDGLGLEPFGDPDDDGVPEPLQFVLNDRAHLMPIPTGGFGWVTSSRPTASPGTSECLLTITTSDRAAVGELVERARAAGAEVLSEPGDQPWGWSATFADPDGHVWQVTTPHRALRVAGS